MVPHLAQRTKMLQSLQLAREVQQSLLPQTSPNVGGLDVHGQSRYCDETGGDYYDFVDLKQLTPGLLGIVIGDVSGHGVPSVLLMTTVRALLRSFAEQGLQPHEIMDQVNRFLSRNDMGGRFMTLFYIAINASAKTMHWASAGHDAAILYRTAEDAFGEFGGEDIPLGVDPDWVYTQNSVQGWQPGDIALLGTDGIWEARNEAGEMFGKIRMKDVLKRECRGSAQTICAAIMQSVDEFRGDVPQADDITMIVIRATY
jgi:sigma-B regulation protein RsbU (phosphoserine phosphatase)